MPERANLNELPRAEGLRGEQLPVDEFQTLYLGGLETISAPHAGGGLSKEVRSRAGLEPSTARDAALPAGLRVTEESIREAVVAEGDAIAADAERELQGLPPVSRPPLLWWTLDVWWTASQGKHRQVLVHRRQ